MIRRATGPRTTDMNAHLRLPLTAALVGVAAFPAASALAGPATAHVAATRVVRLQNVAIHPARLAIHAGDRVTWKFLDAPATEHTVTPEKRAGGQSFRGTGAHFSGSYSVTFSRRGTYYYQCLIHPGMQGRIVVR